MPTKKISLIKQYTDYVDNIYAQLTIIPGQIPISAGNHKPTEAVTIRALNPAPDGRVYYLTSPLPLRPGEQAQFSFWPQLFEVTADLMERVNIDIQERAERAMASGLL